MTPEEKQFEKNKLDMMLELIQTLFLHYIEDNQLVENSPILKPKAKKCWDNLKDIQNHINI